MEIEKLVSELQNHSVKDVLSDMWWNLIDKQNALSQQALLEVGSNSENVVKAFIQQTEKVPTLTNEIMCLSIWRQEILPKLIAEADEETMGKFCLIFIIFFHENTVVSLLEILLYNSDACAALEDSAIDLVDYCAAEITQLVSLEQEVNQNDESMKDELFSQSKKIQFGIGMRCITIIMYLTEYLERLTLSVTTRLYSTHDFPLLLTHVLDKAPWTKKSSEGTTLQYTDGHWQEKSEGSLIGRHEANTWLAIHQLLLHPELGKYYQVTDYAKGQFMRLESKINESLLSQLPPLQQLKHGLVYMANFEMPTHRQPTLLEIIPEVKRTLLAEGRFGWDKIIKLHMNRLRDCKNIADIADRFSKVLQPMEKPVNLCTNCSRPAKSRCSKCKRAWYCGRNCQLQHFPHHKSKCTPSIEGAKV